MGFSELLSFDFVDGIYALKLSQNTNKASAKFSNNTKLVYRNEMNSITFPNFTAMDFNLFFTMCYYASKYYEKHGLMKIIRNDKRDNFSNFITIKFDDLKIFLPQIKNKKRFFAEIAKFMRYKIRLVGVDTLRYNQIENNGKVENLNDGTRELEGSIFIQRYLVDEKNEKLHFELTPYAYKMLSKFSHFMSFDMKEFCSFENKYTKTLFRLLKQYENSSHHTSKDNPNAKVITMSKDEFMEFMDTPSDYNVNDLERKVIEPSIKEIARNSFFDGQTHKTYSIQNVDYEKIFEEQNNSKKKKVKGFQFVFEKRI